MKDVKCTVIISLVAVGFATSIHADEMGTGKPNNQPDAHEPIACSDTESSFWCLLEQFVSGESE